MVVGAPVFWVLFFTRDAHADANDVRWVTMHRGKISLALVPNNQTRIAMVEEKVVLIPYYCPKRKRALMLVHVWYDFSNEGPTQTLNLGFPELHGQKKHYILEEYKGDHRYVKYDVMRRPSILSFYARISNQKAPV